MKYLLNCRSFISLMVLFSFFDNFGMKEGETKEIFNSDDSLSKYHHLFKVVLVGDAVVGKTQIIDKFVENKFSENYVSTVGVDFKVKTVKCENKKIKLQLWDTAGQERFKSITKSYYKKAHLIVFVYAIDDKKTFENIQNWVKDVKEQTDEKTKFLLVGNKCDLKEKRKVSTEEAIEYAEKNNMEFIEVSAKEGTNINDMFNSSLLKLLKDMEAEEKKEEIQVKKHYKDIDDINHIKNKKDSCWSKYCSCCPCMKKTKKNNEEQEEKEGEEQEKKEDEE